MEYEGLVWKYPLNRPLSDEERRLQLKQSQRLAVEPLYQLSVIQMTSTFLECVDKYFGWKGLASTVMLIFSGMILYFIGSLSYWTFSVGMKTVYLGREAEILTSLVGLAIVGGLFVALLVHLLRKESFRFTHYPIRFNRLTRMVHVFRVDGSTLSAPWDEVFFTLGKTRMRGGREILGHILDKDRVTIRETFALSYYGGVSDEELEKTGTDVLETDYVRRYWEFVRRYMEEGPTKLQGQVEHVMNISNRRETFWNGFHRLAAEFAPAPLFAIMMMPVLFLIAVGRWFAMQTSKIPQWPTDTEAS